jgi:23S rRNA (adenine-N6)-dimethyltransferase
MAPHRFANPERPRPEHVRARRAFGQNFLADPRAVRAMAEAAEIKPDDLLYEVGAGRGHLTSALLDRGADVVAFEVDPELAAALPRHPRLSVRTEDFLAAAPPRADFAVVGNIPYALTSAVVDRCLGAGAMTSATLLTRRQIPLVRPDLLPAYRRIVDLGFTGLGGSLHASLARRFGARRVSGAFRAARIPADRPVGLVWPEQWLTLFRIL